MCMLYKNRIFILYIALIFNSKVLGGKNLPLAVTPHIVNDRMQLYYWRENFVNFGDYLSLKLVERIVGQPVDVFQKGSQSKEKKLLAIGSILTFAANDDVVWGSGANGNWLGLQHYKFKNLDVRAVRGPLTRYFLKHNFNIESPEIYGDPALLMPYFFPEFQKSAQPSRKFLVIPHYSEQMLFPKEMYDYIVHPTDSWDDVVRAILDSEFVISSSLHGIIIAEAYGIPARMLRITEKEHIFKFMDYYLGTGRQKLKMAYSIDEALAMGGEEPPVCDLAKLYQAFPFEFWPDATPHVPSFELKRGVRA